MIKLLKTKQLYNRCDTSIFKFRTTSQIKPSNKILGQERASKAIKTALNIDYKGYNLFLMGDNGLGKRSLLDKLLKERVKNTNAPYDWCYINNFSDYTKPNVIKLPNGLGEKLKKDMETLIKSLQDKIPQTFKQKEYLNIRKALENESKEEQDKLFSKIKDEAKNSDIFINDTTNGVTISPLLNGKILTTEEFQSLDILKREEIERNILHFKQEVDENVKLELEIAKIYIDKIKDVDELFIKENVDKAMQTIKTKYSGNDELQQYFEELGKDIVENYEEFVQEQEVQSNNNIENLLTQSLTTAPNFDVYEVNLFVNNAEQKTAPIVYEHNPTYSNLFGRIEHVTHMGTLSTDFNLIRAGSLHRANGGYLIIDASALLFQPYAWEGLKRMLESKMIHLESIEESMGLATGITLNPKSVELDAKIILVGSSYIYYLLYDEDPDFKRLFKIEADFEEKYTRDDKSILEFAAIVTFLVKKYKLLHLTKKALAKLVEFSSRLVDDSNSISINFSSIIDLLHEANYIAKQRDAKDIKNEDIIKALEDRKERSERIKEEIYKHIKDETIQIRTQGLEVGQINGLSVIDYGNFVFSTPVKISALTRVGKEGVVDIEREVDLSGSIHSKGVMILSSFLASRYSHDFSMSLSASLVFEQSYSIIDGDSASLAELYALLSSIANIPINQNFAVTGSINQQGEVQAIGGVNEKIEGFFDVCRLKDEDFKASVIIPYSNIPNLMLKEDIIKAVRNGQFKVYAIKHIDEGIKLLMNIEAGNRGVNGKFPKNSLNYIVENRLLEFSHLSLSK